MIDCWCCVVVLNHLLDAFPFILYTFVSVLIHLFCSIRRKKSKPHDVIQIFTKTRPFSAGEYRRGKNSPLPSHTSSKLLPIVHSASAPAELDKIGSFLPNHYCNSANNCPKDVSVSDKREDESTDRCGSSGGDFSQANIPSEPLVREGSQEQLTGSVRDVKPLARQVETQSKRPHFHSTDDLQRDLAALEVLKTGMDSDSQRAEEVDLDSRTGIFKKRFKDRLGDVSIKFQKLKGSSNTTEILWQNEKDPVDTREPARPTGKRNIFIAAQERGRTFIPDLKNKLSGLSNRSQKIEPRKNWLQIAKERDCKTRIIQL